MAEEDWEGMALEELRQKIDQVDQNLVRLLNQRAQLARLIGQKKKEKNLLVYSPTREREIRENIRRWRGKGPLSEEALWSIYREIISACRALQHPLQLAFLGPRGTFTEIAARQVFGSQVEVLPLETVEQVFEEVSKGNAQVGVVPIENSVEGVERRTLDLLHHYCPPLSIQAETFVEIHHCFLVRDPKEEVRSIFSHPQAFAQCARWLAHHYPHAELIAATSTARGAELAAQTPRSAAIGPALAAEIYGLSILYQNIEDYPNNRTRFFIIGPSEPSSATGQDKTSIIISTQHRAGALCDALSILKKHNLNMTMIESRPSRETPWEYIFFIDFEGHIQDDHVRRAMEELREQCRMVKILGSYPVSG